MRLGVNFFTLLLIYTGLILLVELFFGMNDRLTNESSSQNPFGNSLLLMACLFGFSFLNLVRGDIAWLRLLASMLCCVVVYQLYPMVMSIVDLAVKQSSVYMVIRNSQLTAGSLLATPPLLLLVGCLPTFTYQWRRPRIPTKSLDFLMQPVLIGIVGMAAWATNQMVVQAVALIVVGTVEADIYQSLNLLQAGMFITCSHYLMYVNNEKEQRGPSDHANTMQLFTVLGGVFTLGYYILLVPNQHSTRSSAGSYFCIFGCLFGSFVINQIRKECGQPVPIEQYFNTIVAAGTAGVNGAVMSPGWSICVGFGLSIITLTYQSVASRGPYFKQQDMGLYFGLGAIVGIYSNTSKFDNPWPLLLIAISIAIGTVFGCIFGFVLSKMRAYDLRDFDSWDSLVGQ